MRGRKHAKTPIVPSLRTYSREDWPLCGLAPWQAAMVDRAEDVTCKNCLRLMRPGGDDASREGG